MPIPDSAQSVFYLVVAAVILLIGRRFWQWLHQQFSSPAQNLTEDRTRSFSVHLFDETSDHSDRQWQWDNLTPREMQVAQLAARGRRNSEIARDLHISVRTVETHLTNIYAKLGVRSRAELGHLIRDLVD